MVASLKRIYWDACTWIALIQKEKIRDSQGVITENREAMCMSVIADAKAKKIEIVTSALSLIEVCKLPVGEPERSDRIAAFLENDFVNLANLDRFAGERARELMLVGYSKLKPPDAAHVATAAIANCEEMHTFDDKLLALNGLINKLDGTKLKICKPEVGAALPLLQSGLFKDFGISEAEEISAAIQALEEAELEAVSTEPLTEREVVPDVGDHATPEATAIALQPEEGKTAPVGAVDLAKAAWTMPSLPVQSRPEMQPVSSIKPTRFLLEGPASSPKAESKKPDK